MYVNPTEQFQNEGDDTTTSRQQNDYDTSVGGSRPSSKTKKRRSVANKMGKAAGTKITYAEVQKDYRWKELQRIEKHRRKVLLRVEDPIWKILTMYDATVLQNISTDVLFWSTIAFYMAIRLLAHYGQIPPELEDFPADSITVLGGFLSFFLVFYVNQSHSRFFGLYDNSMGCKGRIFDAATLAVTTLPYAQASRLIRYMNAAHAAGYVGLSKVYPTSNYFNHINRTMGLLTQQERARLDDIDLDKGGSCNREIIVWCMNEINAAAKRGMLDDYLAAQFRDQILGLRAQIGALYNAKDLPIPFFYVHFICLLTTLYLPLFAVTASIQAGIGENANWVAGLVRGLIVVLQAIFVIGLRILGQKLSDPYGDDLIDLSVMHYVHFTWQQSNRILNSHFPEEASPLVEDALRFSKHREHLGAAWEPKRSNRTTSPSSCDSIEGGSSVNYTVPDGSVDVEAQLPDNDPSIVGNPAIGAESYDGIDVMSPENSRVILNPAMWESLSLTQKW